MFKVLLTGVCLLSSVSLVQAQDSSSWSSGSYLAQVQRCRFHRELAEPSTRADVLRWPGI